MPSVLERLTSGLHEESGKQRVGAILENRWFEILIMSLVVCDVLLVMVEGGVDHHVLCIGGKVVPASEHHGAASLMGASSTFARRLRKPQSALANWDMVSSHLPHEQAHEHDSASLAHGHHAEPNEVLQCDTREGHRAHHIAHTCHVLSIAILVFFVLELLLKLWVNPEHFMASFVHKLDLVVVVVSLIIDTVVIAYIESQAEKGNIDKSKSGDIQVVAGLLVISRSWRFVRIFHGFYEEYHTIEQQTTKDKKENEKLRLALQIAGLDPDKELAKLGNEHGDHGKDSEHSG
mmetsp:Transcript_98518/g.195416  ORF Transcript_98518/g.195416 Transcript_98518/m.195416 type:complete len:291 (-) Transcript_98518:89-961(-)